MVRKKPIVTEPGIHKEYKSEDNMVLHVAYFLRTCNNNRASYSEIETYFSRMSWSTNFNRMKTVLEDMESEKWIESQQHGARIKIYTLTGEGRFAVQEAETLAGSQNILKSLKAFKNFPPEPLEDIFA